MANVNTLSFTIASGASLSGEIDLNHSTDDSGGLIPLGSRLFGIIMPAEWTAANLTFQGSWDGGTTWTDLVDDGGTEILAVATAGKTIIFRDPTIFSSVPMLKVRSGTSATPVNQAADRVPTLILRSI